MMPQVAAGIPPAAVVYKIMNKHTIDNMDIGACYSVTCTSAATVTAEINGATATLLSLPAGGSGTFFAPADSVCVETEGEFRVLPTEAPAPAIGAAGGGGASVTVDPVPVEGSKNPVASGGVYDALAPLENVARLHDENTFTAAQSFHAPVTVGVPRVAAVRASKSVILWPADMRLGGAIADNDGRSVTIPADSTRTPAQFITLIEASELGLKLTTDGATYYIYDFLSPDSQAGTIGNTRKLYVTGFNYPTQQTWSLSGGKDGVAEVGQPVMLNGNVYIGHGPEGVKARCRFDITTAYLAKAGTLTDNSTQHPVGIELPEDPARTIDTLIAEINAQGEKLEIKAIKYNATNFYLEASVPGSFANGIVFTRTGCLSTAAAGTAQTITQGSAIKGLDEGTDSEWELRQNGYPVASRQTNNVYEGVQVFNNAVSLNGPTVLNGEVSASSSGLSAFTRNLFMQSADAYASCSTQDDVLAVDPMIAWRHAVYIHQKNDYILSTGFGGVSKCLGNFGNTDRVLYIDFDYKGYRNGQFAGVYCKAAFVNMRHAHNDYTFTGMKAKALYIYCASLSTRIDTMVKQLDILEELCLNLPECPNWATSLEWSRATLKKAVFMTTGTCTSLAHLSGWGAAGTDFPLLTSLKMGDVSNVTNADNAFQGFTKVPSSDFPVDWPALSTGKNMFTRCSLLAVDKANTILDSLPDWSTEETPADHTITFTGTAAATAWAAEGADLSHVEAAEAKGWTVER